MKAVTKFLFQRRVYLPSTGVLLVALIPELQAAGYEFLTLSEIQALDRR